MVQEGIGQITLEPLLPEKAENPRGKQLFLPKNGEWDVLEMFNSDSKS